MGCLFQMPLLWIVLSLLVGVIATPVIPIQRDWENLPQEKMISYSAIIEFSTEQYLQDLIEDHPRRIANLARLAHSQMVTKHRESQVGGPIPKVMVAFAHKNEIFFASSVLGPRQVFQVEPSPGDSFVAVRQLVNACQTATRSKHKTNARCAEPNVMDIFFRHREKIPDAADDTKQLIVAWWAENRRGFAIRPCKPVAERYGCQTFLETNFPHIKIIAERDGIPDRTDQDQIGDNFSPSPREISTRQKCLDFGTPTDGEGG